MRSHVEPLTARYPRLKLLTPILIGLFVARLLIEQSGVLVSLPVAILIAAFAAFVFSARLIHAPDHVPWWIVLPAIYVLWPEYAPDLGLWLGAAVILILLMPRDIGHWNWDVPIFVGAFAIYAHMLSPGVLPADSGELQKVAVVLGIAHPPGYALYTMIAHLFTLLPINNLAWRVNLFSALTAAATLATVSASVRQMTTINTATLSETVDRSPLSLRLHGDASRRTGKGPGVRGRSNWGSLAAAIAVGATPAFWMVGTTASVRPLTGLFAAGFAYAVASFAALRKDRYLVLLALLIGLGLAHHPSLLFAAVSSAVAVLLIDPRFIRQPRRWIKPIIAVAVSLLVLLYLPIRAAQGAADAPADLLTLDGFLNVVLARGFGDHFFTFTSPDILFARLQVMVDILRYEFGDVLLLAALVGAMCLAWRDKRLLVMIAGGALLHILITATFGSPQISEYLIPAYVLMSLLIGYGVNTLARLPVRGPVKALGRLGSAAILLGALALAIQTWPNMVTLANTPDAQNYADTILRAAPQNAIILANWHWFTPLDYATKVDGQRPDLDVEYVYPQGAETPVQTWLRRLDAAVATGRPVIVTWNFQAEYDASPYTFEPLGEALLVRRNARRDLPDGLTKIDRTFGDWRLIGYRVMNADIHAGDDFAVELAWQAMAAPVQDTAFFVHLLGAEGIPVGQYDLRHAASKVQSGDIVYDRYSLAVPPGLLPGTYDLVAGAYTVTSDGKVNPLKAADGVLSAKLTALNILPDAELQVTQHPMHIAFDGCPTLVGEDYDFSEAERLGKRIFLHWQGTPYSTKPCTVSLQVDGSSNIVENVQIAPLLPGYRQTVNFGVPSWVEGLSIFVSDANGQSAARRTAWGISLDVPLALPDSQPQDRYVPLGGGITLVRADLAPATQAGSVSYSLRFMARRPLLRDDSLSLRFSAPGWPQPVQQDSAPALGALPTLKWLQGPTITDRHFARMPGSADRVSTNVVLYDSFTQRSLPILDPKLAQEGPILTLEP